MKKDLVVLSLAVLALGACNNGKNETAEAKEAPAPRLEMQTFFKNGEKSTFRYRRMGITSVTAPITKAR